MEEVTMESVGDLLKGQFQEGTHFGSDMTDEQFEQMKVDDFNSLPGNRSESDGFYHCEMCNDKGIYAFLAFDSVTGRKRETHAQCPCGKKRQALRRIIASGLGDAIKDCTFDNYQVLHGWQKSVKDKALQFCEKGGQVFFMGGQSGAGKTHLCTAVAMSQFNKGRNIKYMIWPKELPVMQGLVNEPEQYSALMTELETVDVLYIDDLFKNGSEGGRLRPPSGAETKRAFEIINQRCINKKITTIISSEFTIPDLANIDEALAGRIVEKANDGEFCINLRRDPQKNWRMRSMLDL